MAQHDKRPLARLLDVHANAIGFDHAVRNHGRFSAGEVEPGADAVGVIAQ
jgi:hypothetical protein